MLAGFEVGLDRPQFAVHLRLLSDIFLRLIKVIVAPLILGTLVTGIAGHGDLKKVGRIGLKSLIYFEVGNHSCVVHRDRGDQPDAGGPGACLACHGGGTTTTGGSTYEVG